MPAPDAQSRQQVEERRERLRELMTQLEQALARPSGRDATEWQAGVRAVTDQLAAELEAHIDATERTGGLFDELCATAPRLSDRIEGLREEHPRLLRRLGELQSALGTDPTAHDPAAAARVTGVALLGELARHRHAGADLLHEAYWVDVATGD